LKLLFSVNSRCITGRFALPPHITVEAMEYLRLLKEDIFWGHCVFMMREGMCRITHFTLKIILNLNICAKI